LIRLNLTKERKKTMKSTIKNIQIAATIATVVTLGMWGSTAQALEGTFRGKVSLGVANYSLASRVGDISSTYNTLGLGVSYIYPSNVFADFSIKGNLFDSTYDISNPAPSQLIPAKTLDRSEIALTVGKPFNSGIQGTVGLFSNKTELSRNLGGEISQKTVGVSGGVGKGFAIDEGKLGVIAVSGGVALVKGTYDDILSSSRNSKTSLGFSAATAYSYVLSKNLSASVDAKFQTYFLRYTGFAADETLASLALSLNGQF
jgi:hypothetical protein